MNAATERIAQAACARLFAASTGLVRFSFSSTVVTMVLLWTWAGWLAPRLALPAGLLLGALACGLAAVYYGFRVKLDAELFALRDEPGVASDADFAAGIDAFRAALIGGQSMPGELGSRYDGALRLWRRLAAALGLQTALLAGALGAAWWIPLAGG